MHTFSFLTDAENASLEAQEVPTVGPYTVLTLDLTSSFFASHHRAIETQARTVNSPSFAE